MLLTFPAFSLSDAPARGPICRAVYHLRVGLLVLLPTLVQGQTPALGTDHYAAFKKQNLSSLWQGEKLANPIEQKSYPFPEPLGFIGADRQRFYLHYTTVRQDAANPYVYHVAGKTRVKSTICSFTGTITVLKAQGYPPEGSTYVKFPAGEVTCRVDLAEDRRQLGSGTLVGTLTSRWFLDANGKAYYNVLDFGDDDRLINNQCVATWTSYATRQRKPCHWGIVFIPQAGDLFLDKDGSAELNPKYTSHGWQTYVQAKQGKPGAPQTRQAQAEERRQWWR